MPRTCKNFKQVGFHDSVIALTMTKKTTGTFHGHTIYFSFKNVDTHANLFVYVKLQVLFQLQDAFRHDNLALKLMCWTDFRWTFCQYFARRLPLYFWIFMSEYCSLEYCITEDCSLEYCITEDCSLEYLCLNILFLK